MARMPTRSSPCCAFANGTIAKLETSRVANDRKRGLRAVYADGVVEIDFLSRNVRNTTPRPLGALEMGDPLGESVAGFVAAAQAGVDALVTPEQAAQALETALWIEEASGVALPQPARRPGRAVADASGFPPPAVLEQPVMPDRFRIALAQLNPVMGDIAGNLARARAARAKAAADADVILFSELFIIGYSPEDLVLKPALQEDARAAVEELARDTADGGPAILIGAPWVEEGKLYNAMLLLDGGRVAGKTFKVDLPNYGVFDEKRVFVAGPAATALHRARRAAGRAGLRGYLEAGGHAPAWPIPARRFCACPTARPSKPARKMCA